MNIWLVRDREALLGNKDNDRVMRMSLIAKKLCESNQVTWWANNFYHYRKKFITHDDIEPTKNLNFKLLKSLGYKKNTSFRRLFDEFVVAFQFYLQAPKEEKPDLIICSFPTIALAYFSTKYAKKHNIPIIIDVRDPVPDVLITKFPRKLRWIAKLLLAPFEFCAKRALKDANSIVSTSQEFLDWTLKKAGRLQSDNDAIISMSFPEQRVEQSGEEVKFWNKLGVKDTDFNLCFCGTINPYFNFTPIIEAANEFALESDIKFIICGEGSHKKELEEKTKKLTNIILAGWCDKAQLKELFKISNLGLAPYVNDEFFTLSIGNKPIEYFANSLPVATSLGGVLKRTIEENDLGFFYASSTDLINKIQKYKNNHTIQALQSKKSKDFFTRTFSEDVILSLFEKHIIKIGK